MMHQKLMYSKLYFQIRKHSSLHSLAFNPSLVLRQSQTSSLTSSRFNKQICVQKNVLCMTRCCNRAKHDLISWNKTCGIIDPNNKVYRYGSVSSSGTQGVGRHCALGGIALQVRSVMSTSGGVPLVVSEEVECAVREGRPVVALETAIVTHGMPMPHNIQTAIRVEEIIREKVHKLWIVLPSCYCHCARQQGNIFGVHHKQTTEK